MKRVLMVFGTRPEAIKMVPLYFSLKESASLEVQIAVTGQHRDMLDQVLQLFDVQPDFDLNLMTSNQGLHDLAASIMQGMPQIFSRWRPDLVLVHGDTTTSTFAAVAAFYSGLCVGHVEAGLRSGDMRAPWPEEFNRKVTGCFADLHFAPTPAARDRLLSEGVAVNSIYVTGNTVIDALRLATDMLERRRHLQSGFDEKFGVRRDKNLILVTGHRRENFDGGFEQICDALARVATIPETQIIYPVHLNPRVKSVVHERLSGISNISLVPPQPYLEFVYLMNRAKVILTDSGGIQEEAPYLAKPILVMRETTERPEVIAAGCAKLVGTDAKVIYQAVSSLLANEEELAAMTSALNPYGDGYAAEKITSVIESDFSTSR